MAEQQSTIHELLDGKAPLWAMPTAYQWDRIKDWVDWDSGCDTAGNFNGHCILHDVDKETVSAVYNFDRGIMRCQKEPPCHAPKRAMSIVNALALASKR